MDAVASNDRFLSSAPAGDLGAERDRRTGLRTILIGNEALLVECAAILEEQGHEIVAVVASAGPARDWALRTSRLLLASPRDLIDAGIGPVDHLFSITNLKLLAPEVLALARQAAINFHDGPLPAYAGLNTPVWALLAGESSHGVSWHVMTDMVDAGDLLAGETFAIEPGETALSLNMKCFEAGISSFRALAQDLTSGTARRNGLAAPARIYGRKDRPVRAALIDWSQPAEEIARLVSALDHGSYRNPLALPRTLLNGDPMLVRRVDVLASRSGARPGTVVDGGTSPVVATGSHDLRIVQLTDLDGQEIPDVAAGSTFSLPSEQEQGELAALDQACASYENWWLKRLSSDSLQLPKFKAPSADPAPAWRSIGHKAQGSASDLAAAFIAYLGRVADRAEIAIGYSDPVYRARLGSAARWFAPELPLTLSLDWDAPVEACALLVGAAVSDLHKHVGVTRDIVARTPALHGRAGLARLVTVEIVDHLDEAQPSDGAVLHAAFAAKGDEMRLTIDEQRFTAEDAADLLKGFDAFMTSFQDGPTTPIGRLSVLSAAERVKVLDEWNAGAAPTAQVAGSHALIAAQAARTPDALAVTSRGVSISYAELDRRSNQFARFLAEQGVGPDILVGLNLERSVELVVATLAIHKAGGAYVPLDPAYPADRLAHMITDSGLKLVMTEASLAASLPPSDAAILCLDAIGPRLDEYAADPFDGGAGPDNLAYVIYTSGSTGKPKGVMVEHRNVLNFFAGMDERLEPDGVWLAVTSLSFDISVLELSWPLTRGYHVVVATEREVRGDVAAQASLRPIDFSLFYFASADSADSGEHYRLLLDGARFADRNGFEAVWTPERHFHAFGGPYPNPSVTSAAIAATTSRVKIRAGSVVAPLHHPVRIAEEWSLVDNLSNGRVGIAFASGWQPDDFLLQPGNYADRGTVLMRTIEDVRGLWRGERRAYPGALGKDVEIAIYPRPVQPELPFWITSAGNADTFAKAGQAGANILTHLLGQDEAELAEKIAAYRAARREAGHPGEGQVTLMLHSFVAADAAMVKETVRGPLIDYLRTSTNLVKQHAWSFPAFKTRVAEGQGQFDLSSLSDEEMDALLDHAFDRYFETSGLFGTPEDCLGLVRRLQGIGVDEIGCLIDFGIPAQAVLDHLPDLARLRQAATVEKGEERSLHALIADHGVTHLQCTPSLVQMMAVDAQTRDAMASLTRLMVGGEAFPPHLASDMASLVRGTVMNMYGPTETTIWSATHELGGDEAPLLGRPLANQQIYILDSRMEPVRPGSPGELVIGGEGVVRGYHDRPELTAERFIADPVRHSGRAYRTGDLARQRPDGVLEFLGRLDHQVKIRGYRIELGEIEAGLAAHPNVHEAVVVARGEPGQAELVAYVVPRLSPLSEDALRDHLKATLPDFMLPSRFVALDALPRTPNGKVDRNALPEPTQTIDDTPGEAEPADELQKQLLSIWREALRTNRIGLNDNFFDLGGHSLLAVQVHRKIVAETERSLSLTDLFRFPTIAALSRFMAPTGERIDAAREGQERARGRLAALQRRGSARAGARI